MKRTILIVVAAFLLSACGTTMFKRVPIVAPSELMKPPPPLKPLKPVEAEKPVS
jgi:hypothetical protein